MKLLQKIKKSDKNTVEVILNMLGTAGVKGGAMLVGLAATPAYMSYFSDRGVLGVWYTMLSVLSWMLNFDLGMGNGLRNKLVPLFVNDDRKEAKKYISSSYIFLFSIAGCIFLVVGAASFFIDWNAFFNIDPAGISRGTLRTMVLVSIFSVILQCVLRLVSSIFYALQKAFMPNLLTLISNTSMLVFVITCNFTGANNDPISLAVFHCIAVNVPLIAATVIVFATRLRSYIPSPRDFSRSCAVDTFKMGSAFLVLQIAGMLVGETIAVYLVNGLISNEAVVEYNVYYKLLGQVVALFTLIIVPIWSAITKAIAEQRYEWIRGALNKLRIIAGIIMVAQFIVLPVLQFIFDIWLGENSIPVSMISTVMFLLCNCVYLIYNLTAMVSNGLGALRPQMKYMLLGAALLVLISVVGTRFYHSYNMIVIAKALAMVPYCVFQSLWLDRFLREKIHMKPSVADMHE